MIAVLLCTGNAATFFLEPRTWLDELRTLAVLMVYTNPQIIVAVNTAGVDEIWHVGKAWWR